MRPIRVAGRGRLVWAPALGLLLSTVLAGCGSDDPKPAAGPTEASAPASASADDAPAACDLLGDDDIKELAGWPVATKKAGAVGGIFPNGCTWTLTDGTRGDLGDPAEVQLGVRAPGGRKYFETYLAPNAEDNDQEPLSGLGDVALRNTFLASVEAVQGDVLIDVEWVDDGGDDAVAETLAHRVIDNLAER